MCRISQTDVGFCVRTVVRTGTTPRDAIVVVPVIYPHLRNQIRPRTIAIIFTLEFGASFSFFFGWRYGSGLPKTSIQVRSGILAIIFRFEFGASFFLFLADVTDHVPPSLPHSQHAPSPSSGRALLSPAAASLPSRHATPHTLTDITLSLITLALVAILLAPIIGALRFLNPFH